MPGRFPLYIDADIRGQVVEGLKRMGWDLLRAVDVHPERTLDPIHFKEAVARGRVLVGHDLHQLKFALKWLKEGKSLRGYITWPQAYHQVWSDGEIVRAFDDLAAEEDPFPAAYPIRYLKPKR